MERTNYFILLELPFADEECLTEERIKAAIAAKQQQWSRDQTNPTKKAMASRNLEMLDEIRRVMDDPELRKKEREAAQAIYEQKKKELTEDLSLYALRVDSLPEKSMKDLLRKYAPYGFGEREIQAFFQRAAEANGKVIMPEVIEPDLARNIENNMRQIGLGDATLYEFLEMSRKTSCEELYQVAEQKNRMLRSKGEQAGGDSARQMLCGLCKSVFQDEKSRERYDNYIAITAYGDLNRQIDMMAVSSGKVIEGKVTDRLIELAMNNHKLPVEEAYVYVARYCMLKGYMFPGMDLDALIRKYGGTQSQPQPQPQPQPQQQSQPKPKPDPEYERQKRERARLLDSLKRGEAAAERIQNLLGEAEQLANPKHVGQGALKTIQFLVFWAIGTAIGWGMLFILLVVSVLISAVIGIDWDWIEIIFLNDLSFIIIILGMPVLSWHVVHRMMLKRLKKKNAPLVQEKQKEAEAVAREYADALMLLPENLRYVPSAYQRVRRYISDKGARNLEEALRMMGENL